MALTVDAKFDLKMKPKAPGSTPWEKSLLSLAAFGAIVNIGGLGSFQNILATNDVKPIATKLVGVPLFNTVLGGSEVGQPLFFFDSTDMLRFFWFVTCWNIVMVAMGFASVLAGPQHYPRYRPWLAGLFTVGIMLNIWCGDAWLTAIDVAFSGPLQLDSAKTTVAGYIMSGAIQALLVLVFGWECC